MVGRVRRKKKTEWNHKAWFLIEFCHKIKHNINHEIIQKLFIWKTQEGQFLRNKKIVQYNNERQ